MIWYTGPSELMAAMPLLKYGLLALLLATVIVFAVLGVRGSR